MFPVFNRGFIFFVFGVKQNIFFCGSRKKWNFSFSRKSGNRGNKIFPATLIMYPCFLDFYSALAPRETSLSRFSMSVSRSAGRRTTVDCGGTRISNNVRSNDQGETLEQLAIWYRISRTYNTLLLCPENTTGIPKHHWQKKKLFPLYPSILLFTFRIINVYMQIHFSRWEFISAKNF